MKKIIIWLVVFSLNISGWVGIYSVGANIFGRQPVSSSRDTETTPFGQQYDDESNFRINIIGRGKSRSVQILGYLGENQTVAIPSTINKLPVTSIEKEAFYGAKMISVTIPSSVTTIGDNAFYDCTSLASVTILPGVTSIGSRVFWDCISLTSITIPSSVTSIDNLAFWGCTSLTSITIPSSVTSIGNLAFWDCTSLTNITVDANNPNYSSENGILYNKVKTTLIAYPSASGSVSIPSSVTSIGDDAFFDCTSLTSITIPSSVTSIGDNAFYGCSSLTSITIPSSVISIGHETFYNWTSSQTINVEGHVDQASADAVWGVGWRRNCDARINYRG